MCSRAFLMESLSWLPLSRVTEAQARAPSEPRLTGV